MDKCLFCKIIRKEIPSKIVYENDLVLCIMDAYPILPGHMLIMPKKHYQNILECDKVTLMAISEAITILSNMALKTGSTGINVLSNIHEAAGQKVMHAHYHILPTSNANRLISKAENDVLINIEDEYLKLIKVK